MTDLGGCRSLKAHTVTLRPRCRHAISPSFRSVETSPVQQLGIVSVSVGRRLQMRCQQRSPICLSHQSSQSSLTTAGSHANCPDHKQQQDAMKAGGRYVKLADECPIDRGHHDVVTGNSPEHGDWDLQQAVPLTWQDSDAPATQLESVLASEKLAGPLSYKHAVNNESGEVASTQQGPNIALNLQQLLSACSSSPLQEQHLQMQDMLSLLSNRWGQAERRMLFVQQQLQHGAIDGTAKSSLNEPTPPASAVGLVLGASAALGKALFKAAAKALAAVHKDLASAVTNGSPADQGDVSSNRGSVAFEHSTPTTVEEGDSAARQAVGSTAMKECHSQWGTVRLPELADSPLVVVAPADPSCGDSCTPSCIACNTDLAIENTENATAVDTPAAYRAELPAASAPRSQPASTSSVMKPTHGSSYCKESAVSRTSSDVIELASAAAVADMMGDIAAAAPVSKISRSCQPTQQSAAEPQNSTLAGLARSLAAATPAASDAAVSAARQMLSEQLQRLQEQQQQLQEQLHKVAAARSQETVAPHRAQESQAQWGSTPIPLAAAATSEHSATKLSSQVNRLASLDAINMWLVEDCAAGDQQAFASVLQALKHARSLRACLQDPCDPHLFAADRRLAAATDVLRSRHQQDEVYVSCEIGENSMDSCENDVLDPAWVLAAQQLGVASFD